MHTQRCSCLHSTLELSDDRTFQWAMSDLMAAITRTLTQADGWLVDQHVSYDGSVLITATQSARDRTFVLSGTSRSIELARLEEDGLIAQGSFAGIEPALTALLEAA